MDSLHHTDAAIRHALDTGDVNRACTLLHQLLDTFPRYVDGQCLLGETLLQKQQYEEAIAAFDRTLHADPEHVDALYGLGVAHYSLGHVDEAHTAWEQALDIQPSLDELRTLLKQIHFKQRSDRPDHLSRAGLARLYLRSGMYEQAIETLRAVLRQHPDRPDATVALAEALWRANRVTETQRLCYDILALRPHLLKPTLLLAYILIGHGEPGGASLWQRAQSQDPLLRTAQTLFPRLPDVAFDPAHWSVPSASQRSSNQRSDVVPTDEGAPILAADDEALLLQLLMEMPAETEKTYASATHGQEHALYEISVNGTPDDRAPAEQPYKPHVVDAGSESNTGPNAAPTDLAAAAFADLEEMFAQADVQPASATVQLAVARLAWRIDPDRSLTLYKRLIKNGDLLAEAIGDLQEYTETVADGELQQRVYRLLGDAYMHQHRLTDAMEAYGRAFPGPLAAPSAG